MDGLFSKAMDVLETTLGEYPKPSDELGLGVTSDDTPSIIPRQSVIENPERVLSYWEEVDLESKKSVWDEQSVGIGKNQETSASNRRHLAELTKAFKNSSGDKKEVAALLKAYQGEIDSLTKRAKFSEGAFLAIYQTLYDAPDFLPALRTLPSVLEDLTSNELSARRARQEAEILRKEVTNLKSLQSIVSRLEERNEELEQQMAKQVETEVEKKKQEISRSLELANERENGLKVQYEDLKASFSNLQKMHDKAQSELFELKSQTEEVKVERLQEIESLTDELEQCQDRISGLEKLRTEMSAEIESLKQKLSVEGKPSDLEIDGEDSLTNQKSTSSIHILEGSLEAKETLVSQLHAQVQQLENDLQSEREMYETRLKELEDEMKDEKERNDALEMEMDSRPSSSDMDDLKKQIRMLQALVGSDMEEDWKFQKGVNEGESEVERVKFALQESNRKLSSELTVVKVALEKKEKEFEESQLQLTQAKEHALALKQLVERLEDDILRGSRKMGFLKHHQLDTWQVGGGAAGMNDLLSGNGKGEEKGGGGGEGAHAMDDNLSSEESNAMLEIVCGQRERFRKRVKDLEEEKGRMNESIAKLKVETEQLRSDNLSLYEKMRFLEQYNRQSIIPKKLSSSSISVMSQELSKPVKEARYACFSVKPSEAASSDLPPPSLGPTEMRYRRLYEEKINPFAEFHDREVNQSYRNLRLHDKITLTGGRLLLTNKYGRMFLLIYTVFLHLLVFATLYRTSFDHSVCNTASKFASSSSDIDSNSVSVNSSPNAWADALAEKMGALLQFFRSLGRFSSSS